MSCKLETTFYHKEQLRGLSPRFGTAHYASFLINTQKHKISAAETQSVTFKALRITNEVLKEKKTAQAAANSLYTSTQQRASHKIK